MDDLPLMTVIDKVAEQVPAGYIISLRIENGSAWVELDRVEGPRRARGIQQLPDPADKSLQDQLMDALCVSQGW